MIREKAFEPVSDTLLFEAAVRVPEKLRKSDALPGKFRNVPESCRQLWKIAENLEKFDLYIRL